MQWSDVRAAYPNQWLIVEALEAHTEGNQRSLDHIAVIEKCADGAAATQAYRRLHQAYPMREFYFVHTGREHLDIRERQVFLRPISIPFQPPKTINSTQVELI